MIHTFLQLNILLFTALIISNHQILYLSPMSSSTNNLLSSQKATVYTAFMFALAVMLLVVSCPLKRILQNDFSNSASSVRTNQTNINQATASDYYASTYACGIKQEVQLTKFHSSQQVNVPAYPDLSYISIQSGFGLNYFLSGISYKNTILSKSIISSLPLFLQHLRLLI